MNIIPYSKLPKEIKKTLSKYIKEKALGYIEIMSSGLYYYLPLTKELKQLLKIKQIKNKFVFPTYKSERNIETFLRDCTDILYLQVRDTVGSEIYRKLDEKLRDTFSSLFENYISQNIDEKFNQLLLSNKKEKQNE